MHEEHLAKGFYENPEETGPDIEKLKEEIDREIQKARGKDVLNQEQLLGKGQSAEVHFLPDNRKICFKITTHREALGKNIPDPEIPVTVQNAENKQPHSPKKEGEFLAEMQSILGPVKVPRPFEWAVWEHHDDGATYDVKEKMEILAMETIDGPSFDDIFEGRKELPPTFELERFFRELREFVDAMHVKKMIYHRDLHEGNIMIDSKTGSPAVIDFGHASNDENEDSYAQKRVGTQLIQYNKVRKDTEWIDDLEIQIRKHLTALK